MISIIRNTANQIGDKIDVKREIDTVLAAKKYEFRVMAAIPYAIIGYMSLSFPEFMDSLYGNIMGIGVMSACLAIYLGAESSWSKNHKDRGIKILAVSAILLAEFSCCLWYYMSASARTVGENCKEQPWAGRKHGDAGRYCWKARQKRYLWRLKYPSSNMAKKERSGNYSRE